MQSTECDGPEPSGPRLVAEAMLWLADKLEKQRVKTEKRTFTEDLLELLRVLERTIPVDPAGGALLHEVLDAELWTEDELPKPTEAERKAPKAQAAVGDQLGFGG